MLSIEDDTNKMLRRIDPQEINNANMKAVKRVLEAEAYLVDIQPARKVVPGFKDNMITHAGPPIEWDKMVKVQKIAIIGAALAEGLADTPEKAERLIKIGEILIEPNHHHNLVSGMCGVTAASFPVLVIKDPVHENTAYVWQQTDMTSFGDKYDRGIEEIKFIKEIFTPVLKAVIKEMGGRINIKELMTLGLQMGDELHSRFDATLGVFLSRILPYLIKTDFPKDMLYKVAEYFISGHSGRWYPGNLTMGACKVMMDAAKGIEYSTIVTVMSRNGVEFGIKVSSLGDRWFTGPADRIKGFTFPGFKPEDAAPDIGDSAIIEARGLGAMALASSPSQARFLGSIEAAVKHVQLMYKITVAKDPVFRIPYMDFSGVPVGIDIRKVVELGIVPKVNTGMAHKDGGYTLIGAGIANAPIDAFKKALKAYAEEYL